MRRLLRRTGRNLARTIKPVGDKAVGAIAVATLRAIRCFDPDRTAAFTGRTLRAVGPWLRENRIGRDNLTAAFPEKTPVEIDEILARVWDNLGRVGAEFAHMDRIWDYDPAQGGGKRIEIDARSEAIFNTLIDDNKGALIFSAHLGNWELPALAAAAHGLKSAVLFRRPNIAAVDEAVQNIRAVNMGEMVATTFDAPLRLAEKLRDGVHVGMLVDQHYGNGVDVTFFGRPAKANPLLARLARQVECPIHGVRVVRLPDQRFRCDLTEEIEPVRDQDGMIDVQQTMQKITAVIEGWVREHPDQWLWLHRRWR